MTTVYTAEDVAKHNSPKDLWISIHGKVYDLTSYSEDHPGGIPSLMQVAGQDGTNAFEDLGHSGDARETMERFVVGKLDHEPEDARGPKIERHLAEPTTPPPQRLSDTTAVKVITEIVSMSLIMTVGFASMRRFGRFSTTHHWPIPQIIVSVLPWAASTSIASYFTNHIIHQIFPTPPKPAKTPPHFKVIHSLAHPKEEDYAILDPRRFIDLPITSIEKLSSNSEKIVLDLPKPNSVLGLPVGQHIAIRATIDDKPVNRSYTPTSSNKDRGRLELVIKNYDDGLLTGKYLQHVKVGDKLSISGPRGQMRYRRGLASHVGMIAGGTGITPMYQLIRSICEDPRDETKVTLIYANQTENDILLKSELDHFTSEYSQQFNVIYLLSRPPETGWNGGRGRCTRELVERSFPGPQHNEEGKAANKVMLCGPPGMVEAAKGWLNDLGYEKPGSVSKMQDQVFIF